MSNRLLHKQRVVFIQHGDYRDAVHRFAAGGEEFYHAQRYTVNAVAALAAAREVVVICVRNQAYEQVLTNGVRAIGVPLRDETDMDELLALLSNLAPTEIVLRSPMFRVLKWARSRRVRVMPIFADSFPRQGIRNRWKNMNLVRQLNRPEIEWIGNHNVPASRNLVALGIDARKVIPYDYPPDHSPWDQDVHEPPQAPYLCLYVGKIARIKGVEDCIRAVHALTRSGLDCELDIIGTGDETSNMKLLVSELGLDRRVRFLGPVPHHRITGEMQERDVVLVPTRKEYTESGPMTINEALAARTPIVASDHPVIAERVQDGWSARLYRAGDPVALAGALREVLTDPHFYRRMSRNAPQAWERLQCPAKWAELVERWVRNDPEDREWLSANTLASGEYSNMSVANSV